MTTPQKRQARRTAAGRALRVLISSGPTRERIDPVRFISNYSTGHMGAQLAAAALARGHQVTVVSGPSTEPLPSGARVVAVEQAEEMERALRRHACRADVIIMAAAVSDFLPVRPAAAKLSRRSRLDLRLRATPDIVARLPRGHDPLMVGFAVETDRVIAGARRKLREKRLDLLVVQDASRQAPFGRRMVHAWLLSRDRSAETVTKLGRLSKARVARVLLDKIEALWYGQLARHREGRRSLPPTGKGGGRNPAPRDLASPRAGRSPTWSRGTAREYQATAGARVEGPGRHTTAAAPRTT